MRLSIKLLPLIIFILCACDLSKGDSNAGQGNNITVQNIKNGTWGNNNIRANFNTEGADITLSCGRAVIDEFEKVPGGWVGNGRVTPGYGAITQDPQVIIYEADFELKLLNANKMHLTIHQINDDESVSTSEYDLDFNSTKRMYICL